MYFLVYAIFMCELQNIFFLRDMMDNQCPNIFSTHITVYGSHSVKFAFIERENIFLQVNPHFFQYGLCLFIYPHLLNFPLNYFSQNLFCFSYFYRGRSFSLIFVVHKGSCCSSQGELPLFFIELNCFFVPLVLFFLSCLLSLYSLFGLSLSICDRKGEK